MRSLFLKIFLSYWLAQALFIVLAILVTLAMRPPRETSGAEAQQGKFLNEAVEAYQTGGEEAARRYMRSIHDTQHVRLFLFNDQGKELTNRQPPEWIVKVERGEMRTADSFLGRLGPIQYLRPTMAAADGRRYILVIELPPDQHTLFGPNGVPGLGIFIAVISSGLVCYFLARYLTSPVVRLRTATRKLAAGDLSARAGSSNANGRDEMAQLVRDFDAMAERLENLVKAQGRLLNDISHELRSPLARLNVALALARQRAGPAAETALARIDLEANRLNELIGRLLTIARLENGDEPMRRVPIYLSELVHEVTEDAAFEAQSRNCRVTCETAGDYLVVGEPSLLHSAVENVVRNAIRYTQENTEVQVHLEKEGVAGWAIIRVTDSGPGVPDETLDKLFRPFYRIDDARGRQTGGVGLGLAIVERAVRLHGGTVRATNRPQGGLMVEIRLPASAMSLDETAAHETASTLVSES